jgi:hypothetical protein
MEPQVIEVKQVQDVYNDCVFITRTSEVDYVLRCVLDLTFNTGEYKALFVNIQGGEYVEVYAMKGIVPFLNKPVYRLR